MGVRRLDELVSGQRLVFGLLGVARPDHGRVHELVDTIGRHEQLRVFELHRDRVAWKHVGDLHREHIGTTLFQQRGALSVLLCCFEFTRGLLAFPDSGHGAHVADGHRHAVHSRPRGCRKDVAGMNGPRSAILVHLSNGHVGNHAGDRDVDPGVL